MITQRVTKATDEKQINVICDYMKKTRPNRQGTYLNLVVINK